MWEINDIMVNIPYMDRNLWETARLNAYVVAQVNSRRKLTQQDICKFKWEEPDIADFGKENDIEISNEDIDRLKQLSTKFNDCKWEEIG